LKGKRCIIERKRDGISVYIRATKASASANIIVSLQENPGAKKGKKPFRRVGRGKIQ